jgi:hypothetical protein
MSSNKNCAVGWFLLWVCLADIDWNLAVAQGIAAPYATPTTQASLATQSAPADTNRSKPLDPSKAKSEYSPPQSGGRSFDFHAQVDKTSTVTGVSTFHGGESAPFQSFLLLIYRGSAKGPGMDGGDG